VRAASLLIANFRPNIFTLDDPFRFFAEKINAQVSPFERLFLDASRRPPVVLRDADEHITINSAII
jgi:hypothetical protein